MPTVEYKELLGARAGMRIAFTSITSFSELFSKWRTFELKGDRYPTQRGVSDFCDTHRTDLDGSLSVKVQPEVVDWACKNMLLKGYDELYFKLVQREDGILVVIQNNQIIASRWLALLDTEETIKEIKRLRWRKEIQLPEGYGH